MSGDPQLEKLVRTVQQSAKYRRVCDEVVRRLGATELEKRSRLKEAVKATKNKLHQVGAAYLESDLPYARWLDTLKGAHAESGDALQAACRTVMESHASTRERLPEVETFYATLLGDLPPVRSIIDVACGLNPLALPWMPLGPDTAYYAYDIYTDMIDFVRGFLRVTGSAGDAQARDMGSYVPPQPVDVALVLKTIPCLEQTDKSAGLRLLAGLQARVLIVSFPVRSLGGRDKGMAEHYDQHLSALLAEQPWSIERFEFDTELAFRITKQPVS